MPAAVEAALANYRAALDNANASLTAAVKADKSPLAPDPVLEGARRNIEHRLGRLERRLVAAVKHREQATDARSRHGARLALSAREIAGAPAHLVPFLARYGAPLLAAMRKAAAEHAAHLIAGTRSG